MNILRRYVLKELLVPFLISLLIFTFIFVVGNIVKMADLIINKGVNIFDVFKVIVLIIPHLLSFTVPTAVLTSILLVFGNMAANYEIIAMRASGVNTLRIVMPVIMASLLLSVVSLIMNDQILPKTHFAYRQAIRNIAVKQPLAYLEAGRFIKEFDGYVIFVREIEGNTLKNITIYQPQEGKPTRSVVAERGEIVADKKNKTISLKLYNGTTDEPDPDNPGYFNKINFGMTVLPPFHIDKRKRIDKKTKDMTIDEIIMKLEQEESSLKGKERVKLINKLKAEIHKKIAFSFAPFIFALIGIPLALITRRGDILISFSLSALVITLYYVSFAIANTIAINGFIEPAVVLWFPNMIMGGIGIFLMKKYV